MRLNGGFHDLREELLERTWNMVEDGDVTLLPLFAIGETEAVRAELDGLAEEGLLLLEGESLRLTPKGEEVARRVVRAHRLAARLLTDLLELPPGLIESQACRLEHAIGPEVADSICTLLGHPPTAPSGRPIPRGRCCESTRQGVLPAVHPLSEIAVGSTARITFIHPRFAERLGHLTALGLVPGTDLHLRQRHPSIVVDVDQTTVALDADVARDVFVKPV